MAIPSTIRKNIFEKVWSGADALGWSGLTIAERTQQYKNWAQDDDIGGVLAKYMSFERVHPYIKDSIMKPYAKQQSITEETAIACAGFNNKLVTVSARFIKPFGILLSSNDMILWGRAVDWKIVLLSMYERTFNSEYVSCCVILTNSYGKFSTSTFTDLVTSSSEKLSIKKIVFEK